MYSIKIEPGAIPEVEVVPVTDTMSNMLVEVFLNKGKPEITVRDDKNNVVCRYIGIFDNWQIADFVARTMD